MICLTETWLQHDADTRLFSLNNYLPMIINLGHNRNSGVAVYVHESITSEELNLNSTLSYVALKCTNVDRVSFNVVCIYDSPSQSSVIFLNELDELMTKLCTFKCPTFILGDFNIDLKTDDRRVLQYLSIIKSNGFIQLVQSPTRITPTTSTLIDHIIHNSNWNVEAFNHKMHIKDHYAVSVKFPVPKRKNKK